jgi:ferredoxin
MSLPLKMRFICQKAPDSTDTEEKSADCEAGELLTQVAYRAGVVIQQTCGGTPSCTDCKIVVREGMDTAFDPPLGAELRLLGNVYFITRERLACQSIVKNGGAVYVPSPAAARRARKVFTKPSKGATNNGHEKEKISEEKARQEKAREKAGEKSHRKKEGGKKS